MQLAENLKRLVKYETCLDYLLAAGNGITPWEGSVKGLGKFGMGLLELVLVSQGIKSAFSDQLELALGYTSLAAVTEAFKYALQRIDMYHLSTTQRIVEETIRHHQVSNP